MHLMPMNHARAHPPQQTSIGQTIRGLRRQRRKNLLVKGIRALVLLNDPLRHPLPEHRIRQHLHEHEPPKLPRRIVAQGRHATPQILHPQVPLGLGRHRPRLHEGLLEHRAADAHVGHDAHARLLQDEPATALRSHVPPVRDHRGPRVTLVMRVLDVSDVCAVTRGHHDAHRPGRPSHPALVNVKLPPKLEERHVPHLHLVH
eukprot:1097549-Pyramimonas_sp.AAC.1